MGCGWGYKGIFFNLKIEGNASICNNMNESGGSMLSKMNQTEKDKYYMASLICGIWRGKKKKKENKKSNSWNQRVQ